MGALAPSLMELASRHQRPERQPIRDALGRAHDVGHDAGVLEAPHPARPPVAGLPLVGDQQYAVPVAAVTQSAQEVERRRDVAALAELRLDEQRGDGRWLAHLVEQPIQRGERLRGRRRLVAVVVAVRMRIRIDMHARAERLVAGPIVEVRRRGAQRAERPAVEAALERDDRRPPRRAARQLECALDRLGAGVAEEHAVEPVGERRGEALGQPRHRLDVAKAVRDMDQSIDLGVDSGRHSRVAVAQDRGRNAGCEVEVRLAVGVVQPVGVAVGPRPLEVAGHDRREVRLARRAGVERRCRGQRRCRRSRHQYRRPRWRWSEKRAVSAIAMTAMVPAWTGSDTTRSAASGTEPAMLSAVTGIPTARISRTALLISPPMSDPASTRMWARGRSATARTASAICFSPTSAIVSTLIRSPRRLCRSASVTAPRFTCATCAPPPMTMTRLPKIWPSVLRTSALTTPRSPLTSFTAAALSKL